MNIGRKNILFNFLLIVTVFLMVVVGCAPKGRVPSGIMDNPEHHFEQGLKYLDQDKINLAREEFEQALSLAPDYGPALAGKGYLLVLAGDKQGFRLIQKGERKAKGKEQKIACICLEMRGYIAFRKLHKISPDKLILQAKDAFNRGKVIDSNNPALYFYMGEAYLYGLRFPRAEKMYAKVISIGKGFQERANERWELVQKANRAAPQSKLGKEIVLVDKLTRADMAGLLIEELDLERFYTRSQKVEKQGFEPPSGIQMNLADLYKKIKVTDIANHPLKNDIYLVIDLGVKGLQPYPDHTFRPNEPMTKVEVALLFEDIIVRATGNDKLASEFIGQESNIPDIPSSHYAFNAVMLCTTRGLLSTDLRTGLFHPQAPVKGVDAVLAIKKLKDMLRLF
ncbi:MAG: S-layer homology domain-containing protein [Desulfonauticus sp.]|nr:S-layer homology domain-containing protein [Desulfonauticus sp.]